MLRNLLRIIQYDIESQIFVSLKESQTSSEMYKDVVIKDMLSLKYL